jgi:putative intracellular protease/amidase
MKIAYVLYPDFTALDLVGPYEVISRWPDAEVGFLARTLDPVRSDRGLTVIPTDTPDTLPRPDLIVPGSENPLRLALRVLLGDRPVRMATRLNRHSAAARLGRAHRTVSRRLASRESA